MNPLPQPGDTWTLEGKPPISVVAVVGNLVRLNTGQECSLTQYHEMARKTLALGATLTQASPTAETYMTPEPSPAAPALSGSHNTHARFAPSSSKRWSTCTGSVSFIEANAHRIPADSGSIYASEGTEAHDWAVKVLLKQAEIRQIPEDFRAPVADYVNHCLSLIPDGVKPQVEAKVELYYQPGETGTCDFAVLTDERVTVRDYKHGQGVLVESLDNTQLAIYAFSLIKMVEDVYEFTDDTLIDIGVFQPRHRESHLSEPWITTLKGLREFCERIGYAAIQATAGLERVRARVAMGDRRNVAAAEILEAAPGLRFSPSEGDDGACRWCPAKAFCEVRAVQHFDVLGPDDTSGLEIVQRVTDLTKEERKLPVEERVKTRFARMGVPAEALTDEYFVRIFAASKWISACLDDVAEWLEARALSGDQPPETKLVLGRAGNRAWKDEEAADNFLKNQKLKAEERYDYKLKSPAKIEEVLKDKLAKTTRTRNLFESLITRSEPRKVLALASDKREAVGGAAEGFDILDI